VADAPVSELTARDARVRVASPQADRLAALLRAHGARVDKLDGEAMTVSGMARSHVGDLVAEQRIALHELVEQRSSLEDVFFELTDAEGSVLR
jgi:ABC-2 type transport system ATP-binding protein